MTVRHGGLTGLGLLLWAGAAALAVVGERTPLIALGATVAGPLVVILGVIAEGAIREARGSSGRVTPGSDGDG
ncbi:MAG: hypothetical protein R3B09_35935 [Nannocystaceae bacterium]